MQTQMQINNELIVGSQPQLEELEQLSQQGVRSVINLRVNNEDADMLEPEAEGEAVRGHGMNYVHLPVSGKQMRTEQVDDFRQFLSALDGPLFVHCKAGKRAGAFAIMHQAVERGWSGKQALSEAEKAGFKCDDADMKEFVTQYVDNHR